jgi:hypothetical protein
MRHKIIIVVVTLLCAFPFRGKAQGGFTVKFNSPENEGGGNFLENTNHEYVGLLNKYNPESGIYELYINKISNTGELLLQVNYSKPDSTSYYTYIIQTSTNPVEYLISGYGYPYNNKGTNIYDFFIKVDSNFNIIWQKTYHLVSPELNVLLEYHQRLLKKKDSGYVFGSLYDHAGDNRLVFFEMGENGDSIAYRIYEGDSAGLFLYDLYYNYDSSAYLVDMRGGPYQIATFNFNFNQIKSTILPTYHKKMTSKLLPDGSIVSGGLYEAILLNPYRLVDQLCIIKHDTSLTLTDSSYFTNPDHEIGKREGYYNSIDYHYPNSIYVAGTYDYDIGVWVSHPSWIALAKFDSSLNLLTEKYIGGDAYYMLWDIVATHDGGVLLSTSRYDYQTQYQEHDLYVIKLDSLDMLVGNTEHRNKLVKSAMVYPNPARNYFYVKTAEKGVSFTMFDMKGKAVLKQPLATAGTTTIITLPAGTPQGNYLWRITRRNKTIETGKLIILK